MCVCGGGRLGGRCKGGVRDEDGDKFGEVGAGIGRCRNTKSSTHGLGVSRRGAF